MDVLLNPKRYFINILGLSCHVFFNLVSLPSILAETTTLEPLNYTNLYTTDETSQTTTRDKEQNGEDRQAEVQTTETTSISVTPAPIVTTTPSFQEEEAFLTQDMIQGLAAGFGFFFGTIILIVLLWCLCCSNTCSRADKPQKPMRPKVGPSPTPKTGSRSR